MPSLKKTPCLLLYSGCVSAARIPGERMRLSKAFFHVRQIAICVVALFFLSTARGAHADSKTGFTDIHAAAAELKRVFNFNVEQYTRPPETLTRTVDAVDLLDQHRLISNGLMHHV